MSNLIKNLHFELKVMGDIDMSLVEEFKAALVALNETTVGVRTLASSVETLADAVSSGFDAVSAKLNELADSSLNPELKQLVADAQSALDEAKSHIEDSAVKLQETVDKENAAVA